MRYEKRKQSDLFASLPPEWPVDLLPHIQDKIRESGRKLIILDDDPTGTQTVQNVPVLTKWSPDLLAEELHSPGPAFYLLTNSRSLPLSQARALNSEIGQHIATAVQKTGRPAAVISRSDSTLRGHFPGEVESLAAGLGGDFDAWLIVPFFIEGGRFTINDIHYVADGDWLVPAGQTEFAKDTAFGYQASNLREWVVEKTGGRTAPDQVASLSLETLRRGGPEQVTRQLMALPKGALCIANAAGYRDLEVLVAGLLDAEAAGKRYLYRTAASFVRVRAGILPGELLTRASLNLPETGAGLVIAGSHVPKTTLQIETLLRGTSITPVEIEVRRLIDQDLCAGEIQRVIQTVNALLHSGKDTLVFTSRERIDTGSAEDNLMTGQGISNSLVKVVHGLTARPRYIIAKGGITSSDIATAGLGIQRAVVLGQILPGVPVWQSGLESKFPGLALVVFPGNVGGPDALKLVVEALGRSK